MRQELQSNHAVRPDILLFSRPACTAPVAAQQYPTKPVRLIVPFPPGGGTDIVARAIAQKATETLGQSVIVDNRAGGGGTIGAETAVRATSRRLHARDGLRELCDQSRAPQAAVRPGEGHPGDRHDRPERLGPRVESRRSRSKSIKDFVAYNKANPGKLNYARPASGGATHLATVLFDLMAGTKMTHIPYKGPARRERSIGGQVPAHVRGLPAVIPA